MDNDAAGAKALEKISLFGDRVIGVQSPPDYKDLTEYWQAGNKLWDWFKQVVETNGIV
jgi:hypothetical protein